LATAATAGARPWGVRLTGGWISVDGGDFNQGIRGLNERTRDEGALVSGSLRRPASGFDVLAEVETELAPRLNLALGIGYLRAQKTSAIESAYWILQSKETISPGLSAVPLTLTATYRLPVWGRLSVHAGAGVAIYFSKVRWERDYLIQASSIADRGTETWRASGTCLGVHGRIGLDFALGGGLSIVLETGGRWARFSGPRGLWTLKGTDSLAGDYSASGTKALWRYDATLDGKIFPLWTLADEEPHPALSSDVRPARIDLSGFSVRVGFRFSL
jgi:opacity protein-like surface antigen